MAAPKYLKIHLQGGIGDCIKVITCNYALRSLYEKHGTITFIAYGGIGRNDCGWGELLKKEVFDRTPWLTHIESVEFEKNKAATVEDFFSSEAKHLKLERFLPLNPRLDTGTRLTPRKGCRNIGIQLSSNDPRKTYDLNSWNKLISLILSKYQYTDIYLFDSPDKREKIEDTITKNERVLNTAGNNLPSSIHLISQMDLVISSDSFSKYICLCSGVPAIILCADVQFMTPTDLLRSCFLEEITYNDNFKLLGVEYSNNFDIKSITTNINEIKIEEILEHV